MSRLMMLCDLDGTLIANDNEIFTMEASRVFLKLGLAIPPSQLTAAIERGDIFEALPQELPNGDEIRQLFWNMYDPTQEPEPKIFPGVHRTLLDWKNAGHRAVLVTARRTTRRDLFQILERVKLTYLIEDVFCQSAQAIVNLDKVDLFSTVMKRCALVTSRTLVVGDTPTDMRSAQICKIPNRIAVLSGGYPEDKLLDSGATRVGRSISQPGLLAL